MPDSSNIKIVCGTILLVAVLGGVFTLAWHGTFTGAEVFGIVMSIIGIGGGVFAVHSGVAAGGNAAATGVTAITTPPPNDNGAK